MRKPTILLVDDTVNVLESTIDYLETKDYHVLTAENEEQAIRICQENIVHLAVLDVRLKNNNDEGDYSGLELANKLNPDIFKIIFTSQLPSQCN